MIEDHLYKPCYYDNVKFNEYWKLTLCICPYGPDRCHHKGCGKKKEEHKQQ